MRCVYRPASGASGCCRATASGGTTLSAGTVAYASRHFSAPTRLSRSEPPPPPLPPLPGPGATVSEERVARWCRRLWDLTRKSTGSVASAHVTPQLQLAAHRATAALLSSSSASPFTAPLQIDDNGEVTGEVVLSCLRRAIRSDQGRIPGVIVESVWAAFDVLVPPIVQNSVTEDSITPATEDSFFMFISTLNELNFDLHAVVKASTQLTAKVDSYVALLRQAEAQETQQAATAAACGSAQAAIDGCELMEKLMKTKGEVMQCCFEARNAGSPLYYTWLWHTAAMPDGLRRLMHFRKLTHFFESLCKRHIKHLMQQQQQPQRRSLLSSSAPATGESAGTLPSAAASSATEQSRCAGELSKWRSRLVEVGLIDGAMSLLLHDLFSKEYLVMEELTWLSTPPSMLDQIMRAESVHPFVRGLEDMRHRLQPAHHRHLFAFLHPAVVEEPLIAVQVALTHGIASSVDQILGRPTPLSDPANTSKAALYFRHALESSAAVDCAGAAEDGNVNTAIFYSINSAQSALRGMDMGNRLIKRVVQEVEGNINARRQARSLTPIHTFSTLSPIPLYVKWLADKVAALAAAAATATTMTASGIFGKQLSATEEDTRYLEPLRAAIAGYVLRHPGALPAEARAVMSAAAASSHGNHAAANIAALQYLVRLLQDSSSPPSLPRDDPAMFAAGSTSTERHQQPWWMDHAFTMALEAPLLHSVATYLCTAKRSGDGRIRDPVGNFHVSNGATVYRLNFLANTTPKASCESACIMVNYWYDLPTVSANAAQYEVSRTVPLGEPIKTLLGDI
ncbi:malonyl-coa decarboxylase-like protein [Leishmania donovani]|uniref:Malonyl-coa decarboxylase-like protein n=1 Tax=Leishmania donovani TaxID=5661 RepID=A0A3S5H5Z5_LEIDO|nr:malonyl-coa decarboxylase-like protein [Leishmania donovani]CAJ1986314.1 malonyl-coa decarboxylase-like protein [Leishmania donovani]VDZ42212.1 malonyl-coa_decarboxylase-like_protein/GeneDB:LmjF.07.0730 [Leishmania donovani]